MQGMPPILVFDALAVVTVFPKKHLALRTCFSPVANSVGQLPPATQVPHSSGAASPQHDATQSKEAGAA